MPAYRMKRSRGIAGPAPSLPELGQTPFRPTIPFGTIMGIDIRMFWRRLDWPVHAHVRQSSQPAGGSEFIQYF